jgi:CelD/BcsL family acetyltransferase involved in cellulose biosynthesis
VARVPREDELYITAFYDGDELVGVLPLFVSRFGAWGYRVCRYLRPLGADPNLTEIRAPLMRAGYEDAILSHWLNLVSNLKYLSTQFQVLAPRDAFDRLAATHQGAFLLDRRTIPDYILPLPDTWDVLRAGFKRNIKESIRRCYNSLGRAGKTATLVVLTDASAIAAQLPAFYALHGTRAAAADTVAHPNYFAAPVHRAFLESLLEPSDSVVKLHLFCLDVDGQFVAMRLGFVSPQGLYLYYSGYDLAYSQFSVMTTLVTEMLQWAIAQGLKHCNFSVGTDVSKTRWGPAQVNYGDYHFSKNSYLARRLGDVILRLKSSSRNLNPFGSSGGQTSLPSSGDVGLG